MMRLIKMQKKGLKGRYLLLIIITCMGFTFKSHQWSKETKGLVMEEIQIMTLSQSDSGQLYIGAQGSLYSYSVNTHEYQLLLKVKGEHAKINDIFLVNHGDRTVYAATTSGLYQKQEDRNTWKRIYYSSDPASRNCLSIYREGQMIYLGTQKGLLYKDAHETEWSKINGAIHKNPIYQIKGQGQGLYIASHNKVFRFDLNNHSLNQVFSSRIDTEISNSDSVLDKFNDTSRVIRSMDVSDEAIVIADKNGIYRSINEGEDWHRLNAGQFSQQDISSIKILTNKNCLQKSLRCFQCIVASQRGAFLYEREDWIPLYQGMETNRVQWLETDGHGSVYAATDKGVFLMALEEALPKEMHSHQKENEKVQMGADIDYSELDAIFQHEPFINEVHAMAVDYAEVHPNKIKDWRFQSRLKALLPSVSAGIDRNSTDLFHYDTGQSPDVLQKGRAYYEWDASVSWDLSDLIWSTDQTTIDSRSKLMVELREDILDQITRLYFERRRIQIDLLRGINTDQVNDFDKRMRIDELTAQIDALTGGNFSEQINSATNEMSAFEGRM